MPSHKHGVRKPFIVKRANDEKKITHRHGKELRGFVPWDGPRG